MKIKLRNIVLLLLPFLLIQCDEDEVPARPYPRLKTLQATQITSSGVTLNAKIIYRGDFEVIRYGFIWSENEEDFPTIDQSTGNSIFIEDIQADEFSTAISSGLTKGVMYYYRPIIETNDYLVYGQRESFKF